MSKKIFTKDSDLQKLTLSPTSTPEESNLTYLGKLKAGPKLSSSSQKVRGPEPPLEEKKKVEKSYSESMVEGKTRSHSLAASSGHNHSKLNEKPVLQKMERSSSVSPPQRKESTGLFSRSSSKSFRNTPLLLLRHKDDQPRSPPIHLKIKDHFMGKSFINPKPITNSSWVKKENNITRKEELVEPHFMRGDYFALRPMKRPTQHHTFSSDASDVQQIEKKLLQLMEDFETGKLKAFGQDSRLRQMEEIREQQERLARLHFDVGAKQDLYPPLSEEGLRISDENMRTLMEKLAQLSESIENLHTNTHTDKKANVDGKHCNSNHSYSENVSQQSSPQMNSPDSLNQASNSASTVPSQSKSQIMPVPTPKESVPSSNTFDANLHPVSGTSTIRGSSLVTNTGSYENPASGFSIKLNNFLKHDTAAK